MVQTQNDKAPLWGDWQTRQHCRHRAIYPIAEGGVPQSAIDFMRQEIAGYAHWYNEHRPHQSLDGATPLEIYEGAMPANQQPRCEPRRQWPSDVPCAAPYAPSKPDQGKHLTLVIRFADRHKKLPIIELRQAA